MSAYDQQLGERLRAVRCGKGLSLHAVRDLSGGRWKTSTISAYERGSRPLKVERLVELAAFYGVPVAKLIIPISPAQDRPQA